MITLPQYDGCTVDDIVRRNSHELTATHLLQARAHILEQIEERRQVAAHLRSLMDDAHRIGMAVIKAKNAGRKTVRISEVAP